MARTFFQISLDARCFLALSRVLRAADPHRSTDYEILAWEGAHTVGFNQPDAVSPPAFFVGEEVLLSGWREGQFDAIVADRDFDPDF